jgi:hypothetical protein
VLKETPNETPKETLKTRGKLKKRENGEGNRARRGLPAKEKATVFEVKGPESVGGSGSIDEKPGSGKEGE